MHARLTTEQLDAIAIGDALANLRPLIEISRGMHATVTPGLVEAKAEALLAARCPADRRLAAQDLAALALRLTFEVPAMPDALWLPRDREVDAAAPGNGGAVTAVSASAVSSEMPTASALRAGVGGWGEWR